MSNNSSAPPSDSLPYYVARYRGRSVAIKRDPDYQATIKLIQKSIAKLRTADPQDIVISTSLADYGDEIIQISEEIWPDVIGSVKVVEVALDGPEDSGGDISNPSLARRLKTTPHDTKPTTSRTIPAIDHQLSPSSESTTLSPDHPMGSSKKSSDSISLTIRTTFQTLVALGDLRTSSTIQDVKRVIETKHGIPVALQQLELSKKKLDDGLELGHLDVLEGTPVDLILNTRKSAIYLLPTYKNYNHVPLYNITIQLSVNRKWELGVLQPHINHLWIDYIQSASWTMNAPIEHTLLDCHSSVKVPWFHWDGSPSAQVSSLDAVMLQKQSTQLSRPLEWHQGAKELKANNSVIVSFTKVENYLSAVLSSFLAHRKQLLRPFLSHLGLTPCSHLAIRFLSRHEYQGAASLAIINHPDAKIAQIVMLYKRVDSQTALLWDTVPPFQDDHLSIWEDIIDPEEVFKDQYRSKLAAVEFTFLEVH